MVKDNRKEEHIITPLVEFAVALMSSLDQINRDAFQRFKLRVGKDAANITFLSVSIVFCCRFEPWAGDSGRSWRSKASI